MGTKWKKSKAVCSFLVFAAGISLLIVNLVPAVSMFMAFGPDVFGAQTDYQESGEFRNLISERLSYLLGVATGGKSFSVYGPETGYDSVTDAYMGYSGTEEYDRLLNEAAAVQEETVVEEAVSGGYSDDYLQYLEEQRAHYDEIVAAEYGLDGSGYSDYYPDEYSDYYGYYGYDSLDDYMADMALNKNLLYAVVYQDKLLYTNIEGFADRTGKAWEDADFSGELDGEAYNFTLWYNRAGDGRVEITKDGRKEDVYGDGIYSDQSRWKVPGYANYKMGELTQDAVIFLAAAREPQLYLVGNDGSSHITQYGGRLYHMRQDIIHLHSAAQWVRMGLTVAVILLAVSFLMRKSRRLGVKMIADFLGKWCLEIKILLAVLWAVVLANGNAGALGQFVWWLRQGFAYYNWSGDYLYEITTLIRAGISLTFVFWLVYLVALDWRMNGKRQKKPLFDLLKRRDFKYPIQKRLVRRQRLTLIAELILLVLFAASFCAFYLFIWEYMNYLTGGCFYDYAQELMAETGFPFWARIACMMPVYVVFCALSVFTMLTFLGLKKNTRLAADIGALNDQILAVREGNLTEGLTLSEDTDLREAAENLNEIQKGMETALREQMMSERMKVDLVTNVSHDIKTPLTSIISYVELLRQEQELPEHVKEFIRILGEKSERLKNIVQDVFEISKATSGQLPMQLEVLDMGKLLRQTLADMDDQIVQSGFSMKITIPEKPVPVLADGQRLYRVFQNLLQNALRYSLEGSRIFLNLVEKDGTAVVSVKNTSSMPLADGRDFTERFVRGDESRTDGGSGLGLSIARSFTEACGGSLLVETDADLFTVTVSFPESGQV